MHTRLVNGLQQTIIIKIPIKTLANILHIYCNLLEFSVLAHVLGADELEYICWLVFSWLVHVKKEQNLLR